MFRDLHECTERHVFSFTGVEPDPTLDLENVAAELESLSTAYKLCNSGQDG